MKYDPYNPLWHSPSSNTLVCHGMCTHHHKFIVQWINKNNSNLKLFLISQHIKILNYIPFQWIQILTGYNNVKVNWTEEKSIYTNITIQYVHKLCQEEIHGTCKTCWGQECPLMVLLSTAAFLKSVGWLLRGKPTRHFLSEDSI